MSGRASRALALALASVWAVAPAFAAPSAQPAPPPADDRAGDKDGDSAGDDRSRDDEIFGGDDGNDDDHGDPGADAKPTPTAPPPATKPLAPAGADSGRAGSTGAGAAAPTGNAGEDFGDERLAPMTFESAAKDRLQIGGLLYLRNGFALNDQDAALDQPLTVSNLTDVYLDARPSDRVRAFVRGRLLWTPTIGDTTSSSLLGFSTGASELAPQLVELWIKFDIVRAVYVTVGAQQVRFGATRLWNPVDVIYSTRRSPLTLFDQRTGLPMLKLHLPIEKLGWNAYLLALADGASDLRGVGLVGRLEMVVGTAEVGLLAKKRLGEDWRFGLDGSAGVGPVDVGAELGMRLDAAGRTHWMLSAKLEHTLEIGDDDAVIWGVEAFYNPEGKASLDAELDAMEAYFNALAAYQLGGAKGVAPVFPLQFFYTGRYYAAFFAAAMGPGSLDDTNFTLSLLTNLSDRSATARLDVSQAVLQHLRLEAYVSVNLGDDGEFRFYSRGLKERLGPAIEAAGQDPDAIFKVPVGQFGINLRMTL